MTLAVAFISVQSAAQMAPNARREAAPSALLASGAGFDELCGHADDAERHDHCPFCHKLGEPPDMGISSRILRLTLIPGSPSLKGDLLLAPQRGNSNVSARAPPALA